MTQKTRYTSPAAVEAAIAAAAKKAFAADPSITVQERIHLEYFHRFLSRIFSEKDNAEWILKGGASMLARVPSTRATTDVDLFRRNCSLAAALEELQRLASIDLDDFFRFEYVKHSDAVDGNQQTYTKGYQVEFDVYIGVKKKTSFHVDLVVNTFTTDVVEMTQPVNALELPKLTSSPYRLYPVVDQIADKVCATLALYNGHPSSREKDLVDLVVLATTQDINANKLIRALRSEAATRSLSLPAIFTIPPVWGAGYTKLTLKVPACLNYHSIDAAKELMHIFLDPALSGSATNKNWSHDYLDWV
jgi:hypothetical protein